MSPGRYKSLAFALKKESLTANLDRSLELEETGYSIKIFLEILQRRETSFSLIFTDRPPELVS